MNLILSVVHGMEYDAVAPFLETLALTKSDAKVHFFVAATSQESIRKMEAQGVVTHPFHYISFRRRQPMLYLWPLLFRRMMAKRDFEGKCKLGKVVFHLFASRFIYYYEFLTAHRNEFENVLVTDCRDVCFQRDPFSDNLGPGIHCFLEAKTQIIGQCTGNSRMVRESFGPEVLKELSEYPVSCAGTTIADTENMLVYLKAMIETAAGAVNMFGGSDQGLHNYIVHKKLVPNIHVHDNYNSTVFTAGCEPLDRVHWNDADEIIRNDGKPYPVMHQYDRIAAMRDRVLKKLQPVGPGA